MYNPTSPTTSATQTEANRANAKHSTGPTSGRGKTRSSQNAVRHGLTGRVVVLPGEDMDVYLQFARELVDSLEAQTPMERQFAQTVADTQWRLNRARTIEDGMLALGHVEDAQGDPMSRCNAQSPELYAALTAAKVFRERSKDFVNLSLYEQRLHRSQKEALRQLQELQDCRLEKQRQELAKQTAPPQTEEPQAESPQTESTVMTATAGAADLSPAWNPADDGFVYSSAQIDLERRRHNHIDEVDRFAAEAASL